MDYIANGFFLYMLVFSPAILVIDILIIRRIIKRGGWKKYKNVVMSGIVFR